MLKLRDRLMYRVVRPAVGLMPPALFAWVARGVAMLWGLWMTARNRRFLSRCLAVLGRSTGLAAQLRFASRIAYQRLRHLDFYCYDRPIRVRFEWHAGEVEQGRCIYVVCNMLGSEMMREFVDRYPCVVIRALFGGEGTLPPPKNAPPEQRWQAHLAAKRFDACKGRLIEAGHPMAYRSLRGDSRGILVYQDVWDARCRCRVHSMLGHPTALPLGAIRLSANLGGLPIRFVSVVPQGGTWVFFIGPRLPQDENAAAMLAARVDEEIRRRPEAWQLWWEFLSYIDRPAGVHSRVPVKNDSGTATTLASGA